LILIHGKIKYLISHSGRLQRTQKYPMLDMTPNSVSGLGFPQPKTLRQWLIEMPVLRFGRRAESRRRSTDCFVATISSA